MILDKKLAWQDKLDEMLFASEQLTQKIQQNERDMFADIDKSMQEHMDNYIENLDQQTKRTIEAENEKKKAAREALEWQMYYATESAMTAVDQAQSAEETAKAVLNSIRETLKAYLADFIATAATKALKSVPFPFNLAAAAAAGGAAGFLFNKLVPEFAEGGHTIPGPRSKPAGIVHAGEYVIPQKGLQVPLVRQLVNILENARLKDQWHNIKINPDLTAFADKGFLGGGYTSQPALLPNASAQPPIYPPSTWDPETSENLLKVLKRLENWQPKLALETIQKGLDSLNDIQKRRGL
jgi:hypothetical protein